jgi:hypothetical protein
VDFAVVGKLAGDLPGGDLADPIQTYVFQFLDTKLVIDDGFLLV